MHGPYNVKFITMLTIPPTSTFPHTLGLFQDKRIQFFPSIHISRSIIILFFHPNLILLNFSFRFSEQTSLRLYLLSHTCNCPLCSVTLTSGQEYKLYEVLPSIILLTATKEHIFSSDTLCYQMFLWMLKYYSSATDNTNYVTADAARHEAKFNIYSEGQTKLYTGSRVPVQPPQNQLILWILCQVYLFDMVDTVSLQISTFLQFVSISWPQYYVLFLTDVNYIRIN